MKYGLDNYLIHPFISLIFSFFIILGSYYFGNFIIKYFKLENIFKNIIKLSFLKLLLGLYFLGYGLFLLSLYGLLNKFVFQIIASVLMIYGLIKIINVKNFYLLNNKLIFQAKNLHYLIITIVLILYFFISSSPITNADALDYHVGVPIFILNYGYFPIDWSWFHAKQAGTGELLIALGLSIGAEQFGNLAQFSGLIVLTGLFLFLEKKKTNNQILRQLIAIGFLSSPILIFLTSTPKPQLLNIAGTSICFCITFFALNKINKSDFTKALFLIFSILFISITSKYYFAFSSFLITICVFYKMYKRNFFIPTLKVFIISGVVFLLPFFVWKYINFDLNFFHSIFSAVPRNLPGYESFNESLSSCGYRCIPFWIIFPPSVNEFTQTFGFVSVFFLFLIFGKIVKRTQILFLIFTYFLIGLKFGQSNPRFFLEPLIWMLLWIIVFSKSHNFMLIKFSKLLVITQSLFIILILGLSSYFLFPGSITKNLRNNVMNKYANGYSLFKWSSNMLPSDARVITSHRSTGLSENHVFSTDFLMYVSSRKDIDFYLGILKSKKPEYLISYGTNENYFGFENCIINKSYERKNVGKISTRNFYLNKKREFYNGYIYRIDYNKLPQCYNK